MDWTVQDSNPGGVARFFRLVQTGPDAHPASCAMGKGFLSPGVKYMVLTIHSILVPGWIMSRPIPPPPFCACNGMLQDDLYLYLINAEH